jgi:hypothetical protein
MTAYEQRLVLARALVARAEAGTLTRDEYNAILKALRAC